LIVWYNYNPDSPKLERKTFNLNRIPDLQQRRTMGNTLATAINKALRGGWNVFVPNGENGGSGIREQRFENAEKALRWALSEHIKTRWCSTKYAAIQY
jgi:hypothetical protein